MAVITAPLMIFVLGIVASFYLLIRSRAVSYTHPEPTRPY